MGNDIIYIIIGLSGLSFIYLIVQLLIRKPVEIPPETIQEEIPKQTKRPNANLRRRNKNDENSQINETNIHPNIETQRVISNTSGTEHQNNINVNDNAENDDVSDDENDSLKGIKNKKQLNKAIKKREKAKKAASSQANIEALEERRKEKEKKFLEKFEKENEEELERERKFLEEQKLKEQKEKEEYDEWKKQIEVEDEGNSSDIFNDEKTYYEFINYIKDRKVVQIEDLALKFNLKIEEIVNRLEHLDKLDNLNIIIDDKGKIIYITEEEINKLVQFVKSTGRVSISKLTRECNNIIQCEEIIKDDEITEIQQENDIQWS